MADGKLSGTKLAVPDGDVADFAIVAVQGDRGPSLAIVDLTGPGVTRETVTTIDPTRSHARSCSTARRRIRCRAARASMQCATCWTAPR